MRDDNTTYSFIPSDWSTIIPLLTALEESDLPHHNFVEWLNQWNQFDIAIWDAYTRLKRSAYARISDIDAERIYQKYVGELYSVLSELRATLIRSLGMANRCIIQDQNTYIVNLQK
jgi:hypothetical protein